MWDKFETIFPEALPAVRRQPIAIRVLLFLAVLAISVASAIGAVPLLTALRQGTSVEVPVRQVVSVFVAFVIGAALIFVAAVRLRRRSQLKSFVRQWLELRSRFELLHIRIDGWLVSNNRGLDDPEFTAITDGIQDYFARRAPLPRLLFHLGEGRLVAKDSQHWLELKVNETVFKQRDYLTPFGFILDLGAPIGSIKHHNNAIWAALHISDEYIEYLKYKYPFLESAAA